MRVALLGTGKMGAAIARRLADAGFDLTLWNRTLERARAVGVGTVAVAPGEAAEGADVVLSILFGPESVREVLGGLRTRGQVVVEMSTAGVEVLEELAPALEGGGSPLLAAPLLGTVSAIEQGSATILVGGEAAAFERARPVLEAFGRPEHVGSRREAAALKLLNNAMMGGCALVAVELLAAARREGLDREAAFRTLCRTMPYLQARRRGYLDRDHSQVTFQLDGLVKDLELALRAGHAAGAAMPVIAQARELYAEAAGEHGAEEMTAVTERYGP